MTNNKLTASRFLPECLKPEEISGDKRESRLNELMNWFDRYYNGNANPKWFKSHAAELCYFILSESELQERRKLDSAEPVGWTDAEELRSVEKDGLGYLFKANPITPNADLRRVIKLYAAPQPEPDSEDRKTLKRLAVILSGSDAPGEIQALTVTAQSFVDRCKMLARELNTLQSAPEPRLYIKEVVSAKGEPSDILPCPFCGGMPHRVTIENEADPCFGGDVITCVDCGASSHVEYEFKENLVSIWNNRAAPQKLTVAERVELLEYRKACFVPTDWKDGDESSTC